MRRKIATALQSLLMSGVTCSAIFAATAAVAQIRAFAIPAEPAATGIADFGRQAGVQILAPASATDGRRTSVVTGSLTIEEALRRLLIGADLKVLSIRQQTILLESSQPHLQRAGGDDRAPIAEATPALEAEKEPDEVIVTGTRSLSRTVTSSLAPIDVLTASDMSKSGKQSTRDLISTLVPSANTSNSGAGASFAVKTLSLRGLSADQTLVLVDGKRRHDTAILFVNGTTQNGQSPADLDLIPVDSIARIEVLRDGASAQYGSDALAGVVNIILKTSSQGGSAETSYGQTSYGDGQTGELAANLGFKLGDQGFLNLTGDVRYQGLTDRGALGPNMSQLYFPVGGGPDPREITADRHTSHPGQPQVQLYSLVYNSDLPIASDIDLYSFGTVSSRDSAAWLTFRNPDSINNNTLIFPNGYSPRLFLQDRDYQIAVGVRGQHFYGFKWDFSTNFSRDDVGFYTNSLNASLGPISPTHFYVGSLRTQEITTNLDLNREVDTHVFANPTFLALGMEYRDNRFNIAAGEPDSYINGDYLALRAHRSPAR